MIPQVYVTLPLDFIATKYPGYFWHVGELRLYSMKVSGVLRPMKMRPYWSQGARHPMHGQQCYAISVSGRRRYFFEADLLKLAPATSEVPVA